jgi:hypothetical protein
LVKFPLQLLEGVAMKEPQEAMRTPEAENWLQKMLTTLRTLNRSALEATKEREFKTEETRQEQAHEEAA